MIARPRKCACGCGERFTPARPLQRAASPSCALRIAAQKRDKAERREHRAKVHAARPLSWYRQKAQAACNAYIRERDKNEPCISCGRFHDGQWHAGHYLTTAAHPELRFNELNIHKQCAPCNNHKSGNLTEYRPALIEKIGLAMVEWLEGQHDVYRYTRDDYLDITAYYRDKMKGLK